MKDWVKYLLVGIVIVVMIPVIAGFLSVLMGSVKTSTIDMKYVYGYDGDYRFLMHNGDIVHVSAHDYATHQEGDEFTYSTDKIVKNIKSLPESPGGAENPVGLSATKNSNGDWLISVNSGGGQDLGDIRIQVSDPNTGESILSENINSLAAANGTYYDNNHDSKIDSGDSIVLKSGGSVIAGMKVQLLKGENSIGIIKELPS